jgi:hypothetical protein
MSPWRSNSECGRESRSARRCVSHQTPHQRTT